MHDLRLAMTLMVLLSIVLFVVTRRIVRHWPPRVQDATAVVIVLLVGIYARFVWGQLWIVRWIPLPSVIVLANWFPLLLGMISGVLWERTQTQSFLRRLPVQLILIAGAAWSEFYVIPRHPPQCSEKWIEPTQLVPQRICLQTHPDTCSAAAAATILTALDISATEAEMARLCLTSNGTTWLGLYHGLALRLQGSPYRAEFFECRVEDLMTHLGEYPAILCCRLDDDVARERPDYQEERGWIPGISHSTVLMGRLGPVFFVGDPSQNEPELWNEADMANLWTGTGLRIVKRETRR